MINTLSMDLCINYDIYIPPNCLQRATSTYEKGGYPLFFSITEIVYQNLRALYKKETLYYLSAIHKTFPYLSVAYFRHCQ